ncbi:MAG: hypothetical protein ABIJ34_07195 [archaeon]
MGRISSRGKNLLVAAGGQTDRTSNQLSSAHEALVAQGDGHIYYNVALNIVKDLDSILKFIEAIPYPMPSERFGYEDLEYAFIDGGPGVGNIYHQQSYPGHIYIQFSVGHDIFSEAQLSRRMFDKPILVDSAESLKRYLQLAKRGFREANPFIPFQQEPQLGDLVFCEEFPYGNTSLEELQELGSIIPPKDRLGVIKDISSEGDAIKIYIEPLSHGKGMIYLLFPTESNRAAEESRSNRYQHQDRFDYLDQMHIVRPTGLWDDNTFKMPFMTSRQVEDIIAPIIIKHAADPRFWSAYTNHQMQLRSQYVALLQNGVSGQGIVETFQESYGVNGTALLRLAGCDPKQLKPIVKQPLETILEGVMQYTNLGRKMLSGTANMLGMTEEQLIGSINSGSGFAEVDMEEELMYRKVKTHTDEGTEVIGYVKGFEDFSQHEAGLSATLCTDMFNPEAFVNVAVETIIPLGLDSYQNIMSHYELKLMHDFLDSQVHLFGNQGNLKAGEAREFLEDKLRESNKLSNETDLEFFDRLKNNLDREVVGPLLSYGFNETEIRQYILKETGDHPFFALALEELLSYRAKQIANIFENSPLARRMLEKAKGRRSMGSIIASMEQFFANPDAVDAETYTAAMNIMRAAQMDDAFAPALEWVESAQGKEPYLERHDLVRLIDSFRLLGEPNVGKSLLADKKNKSGQRVGRTHFEEDGYYQLLTITNSDLDIQICTVLLMDELALMNQADQRNSEYLARMRVVDIIQRASQLDANPDIWPNPSSNLYVRAHIDEDRYDRYDKPSSAYLKFQNMPPADFSIKFDSEPDVKDQVLQLWQSGFPVRVDGKHKLRKKGNRFVLYPEPEIETTHSEYIGLQLHNNKRSEIERSHWLYRGKKDTIPTLGFDKTEIVCHLSNYLGRDQTRQVLEQAGARIMKHYNISSDGVGKYAALLVDRKIPPQKLLG